jgi:hypothetical protein
MLTRLATAVPLGPVDALFVRALTKLSPRVPGHACIPDCLGPNYCGGCSCGNGCTGDRYCDDCHPSQTCDCWCPEPPIC